VLNAGCPLDLHPRAFAAGAVARMLLGKAPVVLHRQGEGGRFELHVAVSLASHLWVYLENAAREHGFTVAG
jgi:sarcosine oxidase subunit gamma